MAIAYYDVTTGKAKQVINEVIQEMEELNNNIGLKKNVHKKYMNTSEYEHINIQTTIQNINHKVYQEVSKFKYLG